MNAIEQTIAKKLEIELGMEVHVDVFSPAELESLFRFGYSTPSIFSEEIEGETYFYTLDDSPEVSLKYSYIIKKRPLSQTHDIPRVFNERLLSDFYIGDMELFIDLDLSANRWKTTLLHLRDEPFIAIPCPPPEIV